jgi:hypothetical protein
VGPVARPPHRTADRLFDDRAPRAAGFPNRGIPGLSRRLAPGDRSLFRRTAAKSLPIGPFLCEAFGGRASFLDVGVVRDALDLPVLPHDDGCVTFFNPAAAANGTALLDEQTKADTVAEIEKLSLSRS